MQNGKKLCGHDVTLSLICLHATTLTYKYSLLSTTSK